MLERFSRCESIMLDLTYHELMMDETVSNGAVPHLKILSKKNMIIALIDFTELNNHNKANF